MPQREPPKQASTAEIARYYPGDVETESIVPSLGLTVRRYRFDRPATDAIHVPANRDDHGISLMMNGAPCLACRTEGTWHETRAVPGQLSIDPACLRQLWRWDRAHTVAVAYLPDDILKQTAMEANLDAAHVELPHRVDVHDPILEQMLRLLGRVDDHRALDQLYMEAAAQVLATHLLRNYCTDAPSLQEPTGGLAKAKVERIKDYVRAHLDAKLRLRDLASRVGLSPYHFMRTFQRTTGQSPHQFVTQQRMEEAKRLLKETRRSVMQVALDVGYNSPSHFAHIFKRHTGASPSAYRNRFS